MKTLYTYSVEGGLKQQDINTEHDVFRKVLDPNDESHMTELMIAKIIQENPQPNLVNIYDVVFNDKVCYYDMEVLDHVHCSTMQYKDDILKALHQLHALHVVYIDIKSDNIMYSPKDQTFKLFDFDCSGIVSHDNPKVWKRQPFDDSFVYSNLKPYEKMVNAFYELDFIAHEYACKVNR